MNLEQIIARQGEEMIKDHQDFADSIIWSNDDGSEKYIAVGNMADWWIKRFRKSIKEILEGVVDREKNKLVIVRDDMSLDGSIGYEKAKIDTINHLEEIIKSL